MRVDLHFQKFNFSLSVCNFQRIILLYQILYLICHLVINHTNLVDFILTFHLESGIKISFLICRHTINQLLCRFYHNSGGMSHYYQRHQKHDSKRKKYTQKGNSYILPQLPYVDSRNQKPSIVYILICEIAILLSTGISDNFYSLKISGLQWKRNSLHIFFTGYNNIHLIIQKIKTVFISTRNRSKLLTEV